jgi:hypothetical protein
LPTLTSPSRARKCFGASKDVTARCEYEIF